jgi:hypothetical protein
MAFLLRFSRMLGCHKKSDVEARRQAEHHESDSMAASLKQVIE